MYRVHEHLVGAKFWREFEILFIIPAEFVDGTLDRSGGGQCLEYLFARSRVHQTRGRVQRVQIRTEQGLQQLQIEKRDKMLYNKEHNNNRTHC